MLKEIIPEILMITMAFYLLIWRAVLSYKMNMFQALRVYNIMEFCHFKLEIKKNCYLILEGNSSEYEITLRSDNHIFQKEKIKYFTRHITFDSPWRKDIYRALKKQNKKLRKREKTVKELERYNTKKKKKEKAKLYQNL